MRIQSTKGNDQLWQRDKTLFLSSKQAPLNTFERVFDWADRLTDADTIVCFDTSEFEREMLKTLLVNRVPTILVVVGSMADNYNLQIERAMQEQRMLIVVLEREEADGRSKNADLRNQFVMGHVEHVVCGYVRMGGIIMKLVKDNPNVEKLIDIDTDIRAAEPMADYGSMRWSVSEEKLMMSLYYNDVGIHTIHKVLSRPYSTIRQRIKSITLTNEQIAGRQFEEYVAEMLGVRNNENLHLIEWRGDKSLPGIQPAANSYPDLVLEYCGHRFAIECKWRHKMPSDSTEILSAGQQEFYKDYGQRHTLSVFLLIGIGGQPSSPEQLYLISVEETICNATITQGIVQSADQILNRISSLV